MELHRALLFGAVSVALVAAAITIFSAAPHPLAASAQMAQATASLNDTQGNAVGTATFMQHGNKVMVQAEVMNLPGGFHGFHVHATGVCDPATSFNSAGGHYQKAGTSNNHANHSGDMSSLYVSADGSGTLTLMTDRFSLEDLLSDGGRALIVHADPDNFANIPARYNVTPDETTLNTGDAGGRIACGVITRG